MHFPIRKHIGIPRIKYFPRNGTLQLPTVKFPRSGLTFFHPPEKQVHKTWVPIFPFFLPELYWVRGGEFRQVMFIHPNFEIFFIANAIFSGDSRVGEAAKKIVFPPPAEGGQITHFLTYPLLPLLERPYFSYFPLPPPPPPSPPLKTNYLIGATNHFPTKTDPILASKEPTAINLRGKREGKVFAFHISCCMAVLFSC